MLILSDSSLYAQRTLGIKWEVPEDRKVAVEQLRQFRDLGITKIEVKSELTPALWQKIDSLEFEVHGSLGIRFPTASSFSAPDSALIKKIQQKASVFLSQPSVRGIQIFAFGAFEDPAFSQALVPFAEQLRQNRQVELYSISRKTAAGNLSIIDFSVVDIYVTPKNIDSLSVPNHTEIGGYVYSPAAELEEYITPFKKFLDQTANARSKTIFLHDDWLATTLENHPSFSKNLREIATERETVFALPEETIPTPESSVMPIILLLLVWGSIGLHYNSSPLYRKSIFRYFISHKFFIDDIFHRHIRSPFPAISIIVQNSVLISVSILVTFLSLFTPLGQNSFFHHFPGTAILGNNPYSIFTWALLGTLLISCISIVWHYISNKSLKSFTQIATIYGWPLQLNFLFCTVAITLFAAGGGPMLITVFTVLAVTVFLLSFLFTSIDTFRFAKSKIGHQFKTSIPYFVVIGSLIGWMLSHQHWIEAIQLSLNLK